MCFQDVERAGQSANSELDQQKHKRISTSEFVAKVDIFLNMTVMPRNAM